MKTQQHRQSFLRTLYQAALGAGEPKDGDLDWIESKVRDFDERDLKEMFTKPASEHPAQPSGNARLDRILRNAGVALAYGFAPANTAANLPQLPEGIRAQVKTPDFIAFPNPDAFPDMAAYRRTLAHELIHWTGTKARADRRSDSSGMGWLNEMFGIPPEGYAQEEMTAEMGAALLMDELAPGDTSIAHSAVYIANWAKTLAGDERGRAYTEAERDAVKAVDWLLQFDHD